jgi:hypothetical protein
MPEVTEANFCPAPGCLGDGRDQVDHPADPGPLLDQLDPALFIGDEAKR